MSDAPINAPNDGVPTARPGQPERSGRAARAIVEHAQYVGAFLRDPMQIGSFAPSSRPLAEAMVHGCDLEHAAAVVEIGPGTGSFTSVVLERIGKQTAFIAIELNEGQVRRLRRRFPDVTVCHTSAEHMQECLDAQGLKSADYIISGLPWANMPSTVQEGILRAVLNSLSRGGVFTTFAYIHACWLPRARRFRERLEAGFTGVTTSGVVWRNAPPAFVYRCRN